MGKLSKSSQKRSLDSMAIDLPINIDARYYGYADILPESIAKEHESITNECILAQNPDKLAEWLLAVLNAHPNDTIVIAFVAITLSCMGLRSEAAQLLNVVLAKYPKDILAGAAYARIIMEEGDFSSATVAQLIDVLLDELNALNRAPYFIEVVEIWYTRALFLLLTGKYDEYLAVRRSLDLLSDGDHPYLEELNDFEGKVGFAG